MPCPLVFPTKTPDTLHGVFVGINLLSAGPFWFNSSIPSGENLRYVKSTKMQLAKGRNSVKWHQKTEKQTNTPPKQDKRTDQQEPSHK